MFWENIHPQGNMGENKEIYTVDASDPYFTQKIITRLSCLTTPKSLYAS